MLPGSHKTLQVVLVKTRMQWLTRSPLDIFSILIQQRIFFFFRDPPNCFKFYLVACSQGVKLALVSSTSACSSGKLAVPGTRCWLAATPLDRWRQFTIYTFLMRHGIDLSIG
jgi:hypothetical protein